MSEIPNRETALSALCVRARRVFRTFRVGVFGGVARLRVGLEGVRG